MQDNSAKSRNFDPMSVVGLSDEARQAVNAAFDAMSAWRGGSVQRRAAGPRRRSRLRLTG
jgi:hypothetical protein